ncbi:uncharacterized protein [Montipora foliosa]|uniref:uncharacterized protein n=1 Tax=Montipora foliosa TaxID=591990 RepID=UPI0035F16DB8
MLGSCPPSKKSKIERNKQTNAKRDPGKRNPHFSLTVEVKAGDEKRLEDLRSRLNHAKSLLGIDRKTSSTQNADLLETLLSYFELVKPSAATQSWPGSSPPMTESPAEEQQQRRRPQKRQIYVNAKVDDPCFVCTGESLRSLAKYFSENQNCEFCGADYRWSGVKFSKQGHVCRLEVPCVCSDLVVWLSSGVLGHPAKYFANVRMVHAFTCTGLTESQYHNFAEAANIGSVMDKTIDTIYKENGFGYMAIVRELSVNSMGDARREVQGTVNYILNGDCVITDARHDSSRAAMHSTVSAISMSNKKIIAVCNWSRANERSAPSREVPMTKEMITNLIENQGHNVKEIAHDCVMALKAWFQGKGIKNSFDTWHGTKGVARDMKKVCSGTRRDEGIKWFTQLSDKAKATKTHFYWAMRNNDGTAAGFQQYLLNIVDHYQGKHDLCHQDSRCKHAGYICSKKEVSDPKAVDAYRTAIMKTTIYKNPSDYLLCRDTFYIESFHVVVLIYAPKRIHFGDGTYEMRVSLAILDWNENVGRDVYSMQYYQHSRHPGRMAPTRVLRPKTFAFREAIWHTLFERNKISAAPLTL